MSKDISKDLVLYGVRLPKNKFVFLGLTTLYGIGIASAKKICAELGISPKLTIGDYIKGNIQLMIDNGSLRGFRHRNRLPVRGQRTHTNAKTAKRVILGMSVRS